MLGWTISTLENITYAVDLNYILFQLSGQCDSYDGPLVDHSCSCTQFVIITRPQCGGIPQRMVDPSLLHQAHTSLTTSSARNVLVRCYAIGSRERARDNWKEVGESLRLCAPGFLRQLGLQFPSRPLSEMPAAQQKA